MTNIRQLAMNCEAKKHAYRQTQDGVVVSFVLHPQEVPDGLAVAALGTRYQLAMVEIGDDEQPKGGDVPDAARPTRPETPPRSQDKAGGAKRSFNEMLPAQQAGILCAEPAFWKFLEQYGGRRKVESEEDAARVVRMICKVGSRADLRPGTLEVGWWYGMRDAYRAWHLAPAVGAE